MECNRDEATRAKEIAERKFSLKDIAGAKKFALKARNLYPNLEGLSQMLSTLDVYIASEKKFCGEADWYGILGVSPSSDDETVKKQYTELALMLHPAKNKSVGAEGAFKLISEARTLLSDRTKRLAYDMKRFQRTSQQRVPTKAGCPSSPVAKVPTTTGGSTVSAASGLTNSASSSVRSNNTTHAGPATAHVPPCPTKSIRFWTSCNRCKVQFEYLRVYLNHTLLCPSCHEPFLAVESPIPSSNGSNSSTTHPYDSKRLQRTSQQSVRTTTGGSTVSAANGFTNRTSSSVRFKRTSQQRVPTTTGGPTVPAANGFTNSTSSSVRSHKSTTHGGPATAHIPPCPTKSIRFWTSCNHCKVQFEYLRVYLNHTLLCHNCHKPFLAIERPIPPSNGSDSSTTQQRQNS